MSPPDFENMTKDEVILWFKTTNDLSPVVTGMAAAAEPVDRPAQDGPMMLASIRLPVALVEQLDEIAARQGARRSDIIRDALSTYVLDLTSPVGRDEAENALAVLRRIIDSRPVPGGQAA